tara:strand:+ start:7361 stop:8047 length:687 start_codon:yes stop_codon:yes gene_type:complete
MDLTELKRFVDDKLAVNSTENRWSLLHTFYSHLLKELIYSLLSNQADLEEVASRSYFHKNGFLKILLLDQRPKYSVRLHIWPSSTFNDTHIHDHPWEMSTMVLKGEYSWHIFKLRNSNQPTNYSAYQCKYLDDYSGHSFSFDSNVRVQQEKTIDLKAGLPVELSSGEYHKVVKSNVLPADSIVITGGSECFIAKVVTSENLSCREKLLNKPVTYEFLKERLHSLIGRY